MENHHKCKVCLRSFVNGKALGGHMRSHVIARWSSSSSEEEEYEASQNEIETAAGSVVVQDGESETELCREQVRPTTPRCRRSKRIRKSSSQIHGEREESEMKIQKTGITATESSPPASSISEHTSPEEDVAYCLILLSKDKWTKGEEDEEEEENVKNKKARGKYRCESCSKVFRSYQALGGHRASHKKIKPNKRSHENAWEIDNNKEKEKEKEKIHECPICYRVFSSGQALGGHKRSHFTASARTSTVSSLHCSASTSTNEGNFIDLNLPASLDDDDTITQIELSALSDACFLRPH
ncbi:PREDICTED: zinc finger protein ZAT1-like [Ipomoea nil]|uniref:zinc finger protein ZAT1-like n=1 Tax=Ipomoea nil TaxID=35883 RepID=UPI000901363B|nr:PREDICTED: zinc finger protein ZAT1-like [Ipomoea nil]